MPFNVLLLPLLGGYLFITYWHFTRFDSKRYSGERLIFHSALAGFVFLALAFAAVGVAISRAPSFYRWWHNTIGIPHAGVSLGALLLALFFCGALNLFTDRSKQVKRTITEWNDYLEILLQKALEETRQVALTLKSGKVYIGFVVGSFDPVYERKYIVMLPTISGYRNPPSQNLILTTDYTAVYQQLIADDESRLVRAVDDFQLVVPVSEILSANLFDWHVYDRFNPPVSTQQHNPIELASRTS
ncbi:MAG TPA: hypothetical protein VLJ83_04270 [Gemmatimonadaceae bacterium]|nr:hypothetical protein [Gemmatimonadaceae bacterium]